VEVFLLEALLVLAQQDGAESDRRVHLREISLLREETRRRHTEAGKLRHSDSLPPDELELGKTVHVRSLAMDGRIVQLGVKCKATVDMDGVRVQTEPADLVAARGISGVDSTTHEKPARIHPQRLRSRQISLELHVLGLTVNEVLRSVEEYLDQLLLADIRKARIFHGKRTGALHDAAQSYLASCRLISAFGFAPPNLYGVGVAEFELPESK